MTDQPTPDAEARATLIEKMRKQSVAIYTAVEESVADDIAGTLRQAADLLAAEGWQDISTAPKNGSEVLVWGGRYGTRGPVVAHFMHQAPEDHPPIDPGWYFWPHTSTRYGSFIQLDTPPTHWMPLPTPPGGIR